MENTGQIQATDIRPQMGWEEVGLAQYIYRKTEEKRQLLNDLLEQAAQEEVDKSAETAEHIFYEI